MTDTLFRPMGMADDQYAEYLRHRLFEMQERYRVAFKVEAGPFIAALLDVERRRMPTHIVTTDENMEEKPNA